MGETLEYLESLYEAGDFEELENNGECLGDWIDKGELMKHRRKRRRRMV